MKKLILLLIPFFLLAQNKLLIDKNGSIIDIGTDVAQKYIEIPFSNEIIPAKYEEDASGLIYRLREESNETKCITDDFNNENCLINDFRYECGTNFSRVDGNAEEVHTLLSSVKFCKDGETKVGTICTKPAELINRTDITLGKIGNDYWHNSCGEYNVSTSFNIRDKSKIVKMELIKAIFDDWIKIEINGHLIWVGPYGGTKLELSGSTVYYDDTHSSSCELSTSWTKYPNIEVPQEYLVNGTNTATITVIVAGAGEGYAQFKILSDLGNVECIDSDYCYSVGAEDEYACPPSDDGIIYIYDGRDKCERNATCPIGYNDAGDNIDQCTKPYIYYNYKCPTDINAFGFTYTPINPGGFLTTNPIPPEGNCIRFDAVCPVDRAIPCTKYNKNINSSNFDLLSFRGYSQKVDLPNYPNDKIYYLYKCDKDENGTEREGYMPINPGGENTTNPIPPEGNCVYQFNIEDLNLTKYEKMDKYINTGSFKEDMYGIVVKGLQCRTNNIDNTQCKFQVASIQAKNNLICFKNRTGVEEECITIDSRCNLDGNITAPENKNLSFLKIRDNNIIGYDDENNILGIISSSCNIEGKVGQIGSQFGITSIKAVQNQILFWDSYDRGFIGAINFYKDENFNGDGIWQIDTKYTYPEMYEKGFIDFYTYNNNGYAVYKDLISLNECENLIQNTDWQLFYPENELEEEFVENISLLYKNFNGVGDNIQNISCVVVRRGIPDNYSTIDYLVYKENMRVSSDNIGFFCNPLKCVDHMCKYNYCPDGYSSSILITEGVKTAEELEGICIDNYCDSNKPYENKCAKLGGCSNDGEHIISSENGKCYKVICPEESVYNPKMNGCETMKCTGIEKDGKCYTVSY